MKSLRLSQEQYAALLKRSPSYASVVDAQTKAAANRSKYGNRKTVVDGITFDSLKEAKRYQELRLMEKAGEIRNLRTQVKYPLVVNGTKVCDYIADFQYEEAAWLDKETRLWTWMCEDCKGMRTAVFSLKRKLMLAIHGITIRES